MTKELPPLSTSQRLGLAISAACVAEATTYPLDFIKTKLQIQGEYAKRASNGSVVGGNETKRLGMARIAIREILGGSGSRTGAGGILNLYKGVSPAMLRHLVYSGVRMPVYESIRDYVRDKKIADSGSKTWDGTAKIKTKIPQGLSLWQAMLIAGASGGFAQWLASPTDLIKVRMQSGQARTLTGAIRHLYKQGPSSWWRGATPNVGRAIFVNQGDLMTYDRVKTFMINSGYMQEGYQLHFFASLSAGFVACCFATPADTIKTRLMNQPIVDGKGVYYSGVINCIKVMLKNEGLLSFYRGFFAAWPRMGLWSQVYWHSNENLRNFFGLRPF